MEYRGSAVLDQQALHTGSQQPAEPSQSGSPVTQLLLENLLRRGLNDPLDDLSDSGAVDLS
jgi:hypothetical protein